MKKVVVTVAVLAGALAAAGGSEAAWPERAVTIIVPAGAGGGTDATARMLAKQLQDIFGKPFNVVNNGEGGGVVGHTMIMTARPDGYTIGTIFPFAQMKLMGQGDISADKFTPIAQYNFDPAGFHTRTDSPYQTLDQALAAIKADPARFKLSCGGGCAGAWDIPVTGMMLEAGIDAQKLVRIPSRGAAAGLQELVAGGVNFIACSLPEAGPLIEAGKVRPLVVLAEERIAAFPNVPTVEELMGKTFEGGAFRGIAGPAGLPEEVVQKLEAALKQIVASEEFRSQMNARGFGIRWRDRGEFAAFLRQHEADTKRIMTALGMIKG
jgi:tripartite-type tricarboxylate transporter receptor subunit TctC